VAQDQALWIAADQGNGRRLYASTTDKLPSARQIRPEQSMAVSVIPKLDSSCCRKMSWSTVSNATDRPRRTRVAKSPRLTARRMSEWPGRKPDCSGGRRSASIRYVISWPTTIHSNSFDSTDRLEIGRYKEASVGLRLHWWDSHQLQRPRWTASQTNLTKASLMGCYILYDILQ